MRNLTLKGKIIAFKTLALPEIVLFCLISAVPKKTIDEIEIILNMTLYVIILQ